FNYLQDYYYSNGQLGNDNSYPNIFTIGYSGSSTPSVTYSVAFVQTGLPSNLSWTISFLNYNRSSDINEIVFSSVPDGTYPFFIFNVSNYVPNPQSGIINVSGSNITEQVHFFMVNNSQNFNNSNNSVNNTNPINGGNNTGTNQTNSTGSPQPLGSGVVLPYLYPDYSGYQNDLQTYSNVLNGLQYEAYNLNSNGMINYFGDGGVTSTLLNLNIHAYPMIVNDYSISNVENLIDNQNVQQQFIQTAVSYALNNGYSGYSIDFEPPSNADFSQTDSYNFILFLNNFASALHNNGLKLLVAIDPAYNGIPNSELFYYFYHPVMKIDVDLVEDMAYEGYFSGSISFQSAVNSLVSATGSYLSLSQLAIILSTTNPNTNSYFTESQMWERINYTEQSGISAISVWSMDQSGGFPSSQNLWNLLEMFKGSTNSSFSSPQPGNGNNTNNTSGTNPVNQTNNNTANNTSFVFNDQIEVSWSAINVRDGPGLSYSIIGTEYQGSQGIIMFGNPVENDGYLWVPVLYNDGTMGWSASEGLTLIGTANYYYEYDNFWPGSEVYVNVSSLNVRSGPGLSYTILTQENYGQSGVIEFGQMVDNDGYIWVPVLYSDNIIGWSALNYLSPYNVTYSDTPTQGYYYVVNPGDNLWNISLEAYGDGSLYTYIMDANGLTNTTIYVGEVLYIPVME
ncbi:MAG: LysM peptidoglycan-binding domain-containing protein, partial [Thermoplasmata archaeon]